MSNGTVFLLVVLLLVMVHVKVEYYLPTCLAAIYC